jgi:hypothetical protein
MDAHYLFDEIPQMNKLTNLEKEWLYQNKQATKHTLELARLTEYRQLSNQHAQARILARLEISQETKHTLCAYVCAAI